VACLIYDGFECRTALKDNFDKWTSKFRFSRGLPFATNTFRFSDDSIYSERHSSMTNSEVLDPILEQVFFNFHKRIKYIFLNQILGNIIRENIDSWYGEYLTSDKLFQASLKRTARRSIIAFRTWFILLISF
jgi:hypothetical protein